MNKYSLQGWLDATAWNKYYWADVNDMAYELKADGCTGVIDYLVWTCMEHDIHYRTHRMLSEHELTRCEADYIFRVRIQQGSRLGVLSPIAWIRWAGVRLFGKKAWDKHKHEDSEASSER